MSKTRSVPTAAWILVQPRPDKTDPLLSKAFPELFLTPGEAEAKRLHLIRCDTWAVRRISVSYDPEEDNK